MFKIIKEKIVYKTLKNISSSNRREVPTFVCALCMYSDLGDETIKIFTLGCKEAS